MYKARYYKADGKAGRSRELPASLFDGVVNEGVLHLVVKAYLANQRQGTAAAKTRGQVSGGNSKPWRQKGTGRARQGSTRAVQWEGGGRAFPPIPHSWRQDVNRKVKALARRSAFNARAEAERVVLIDPLSLAKPRTAELRNYLKSIELGDAKVLLLTDGIKHTVYLSARNLPNVQVRPFGHEAAYDILWADVVIIERGAIETADAQGEAETAEPEAVEPEAVEPVLAAARPAAPRRRASTAKAPARGSKAPVARGTAKKSTKAAPGKRAGTTKETKKKGGGDA
jgi:large subunit ribosomal protein L4